MPKSSVVERISNVKESVEKGVRSASVIASPTLIPIQFGVVGSVAKGIGAAAGFFASVLWSFFVPGQIDDKGAPIAKSSLESIHKVSSWFARTWLSPWKYGWSAGVESAQNVVEFFGGEHVSSGGGGNGNKAVSNGNGVVKKENEEQTPYVAPVNEEDLRDESGTQLQSDQIKVDDADDNKWTSRTSENSHSGGGRE